MSERAFRPLGCQACLDGAGLEFEFSMAFQPILDLENRRIFAHEALVRAPGGDSARTILERIDDRNRYAFDQTCRVKAIGLAAGQPGDTMLSINFLPNAVYRPETCIRATLEAAERFSVPTGRILFEVTEGERVADPKHLIGIFAEYHRHGFKVAIDDFGAGYSGLNLLAEFQPDFLKLDMALTRAIDQDRARRAIVRGILGVAHELSIQVIAEGVETLGECRALRDLGVTMVQGYLFARPAFERLIGLDEVHFPD